MNNPVTRKNKLSRNFFEQDTLSVAQQLLGKTLVFHQFQGMISETEAYIGEDDPACHAARGRTARTEVIFGPAGHSYVYFIYGMYHCLNIVTEAEDFPGAVLIRGLQLSAPYPKNLDGPGKLCRELGIDRTHNNIDLTVDSQFYIIDNTRQAPAISKTPRIGIRQGQEKLWRFIISND